MDPKSDGPLNNPLCSHYRCYFTLPVLFHYRCYLLLCCLKVTSPVLETYAAWGTLGTIEAFWGLLGPFGAFYSQNQPDRGAFWGLPGSSEVS